MTAPGPRVLALTVGWGLGGAERLLLLSAPRLRSLGFDVRVGALKEDGPLRGLLEGAGVPCVAFGARHRGDLGALVRLGRYLRRERIDVLHAHLFYANLAARFVGRLANVPVILAAHHDTDVWMGPHHRLLERLTAPLSHRVLACSEAVRRYAIDRHGIRAERVVTLRNAIDPEAAPAGSGARARARAEFQASEDDRVAGTLGRLDEPKKGLRVFIAAAARVAAADPHACFVLIGDGPARAGLERKAAALGLGDRVRFLGERTDALSLLPGLDLLVQPSLWEGFGLSVLEGMAAGVPVVATRVGGLVEVVRDGVDGVLVPPEDAPRLAEAIAALFADPELRERFGVAGRTRARAEFHVDRLVVETASLYRALLPGGCPDGTRGAAGVGRAA
ncbi:MAG TPA: glycosyltransferase [Candidatus Polarisedimenticolia bacterium]|nr:glycosyltransferase [Candidatus Polarisedimenticolia bacterium]